MQSREGMVALCLGAVVLLLLAGLVSTQGVDKEVCSSVRARPRSQMPYRNAICTMIDEDDVNIREWIEYHYMLKFDHFYVYNNGSIGKIDDILRPYIKKGIVSLIYWDNNRTVDESLVHTNNHESQSKRFGVADCIAFHHHEAQWLGMWNTDEFLYIDEEYEDFIDFTKKYGEKHEIIRIPTATFGSANFSTNPDGLMIENYQYRSSRVLFGYDTECARFTGKSVYKSKCGNEKAINHELPAHCSDVGDSHNFATSPPKNYPVHFKHYLSRSKENEMVGMGLSEWGRKKLAKQLGQVRDEQMMRFVPYMKSVLSCEM